MQKWVTHQTQKKLSENSSNARVRNPAFGRPNLSLHPLGIDKSDRGVVTRARVEITHILKQSRRRRALHYPPKEAPQRVGMSFLKKC